jgi:uncharacterized protein (TIGR02453 family)
MAFKGWPAEAIEFYEGLESDNSKSYWQANKAVYEQAVKAPMEALLSDLARDFGPGRIFRPYRDVRFSADKSPYKTNIAATVDAGGYISLSADGLGAGTGMYMMAPDQLDRYRRAVTDDGTGTELVKLVNAASKKGIEVTAHESLKTAPKGYPRDHPRVDLLRQKGLITWKQWPVGAWLGTAQVKTRLVEFFRASRPITGWLDRHVGPSEMADPLAR